MKGSRETVEKEDVKKEGGFRRQGGVVMGAEHGKLD